MNRAPLDPRRRSVLAGGGALVVEFLAAAAARARRAPASRRRSCPAAWQRRPMLDSWIRIDADGSITVFTGKAELGQGIKTALTRSPPKSSIVPPAAIRLVTADTALTANEGYTAGSHSMQDSGTAILHAAAQARANPDRPGGEAAAICRPKTCAPTTVR